MKKTHLAGLFLLVQFVCYCKIFHNLTHKVNNPYLLDKKWMIALTVGLLGFALVKIIDAMMKPRHEEIQVNGKQITTDNGSKTLGFIKKTFYLAVEIVLGSFMLNYLINPDSLKALDHAQNSTKALFIIESIGVAAIALIIVFALLSCCCCCRLLSNKNELDAERQTSSSTLYQNNPSQQHSSQELPNDNNHKGQSEATEEQPPKYDASNFPRKAQDFGMSVLDFLT